MPGNFQFGFEHYLYIAMDEVDIDPGAGTTLAPVPIALTHRPVTPAPDPLPSPYYHYNNAPWVEYSNVRTVSVGGNANSVDITTRDEARSGFSTEVNVTTTGEMTFEVRYKPTNDAGEVVDLLFEALLRAWLGKKEIAAVDLDKPITSPGAQGLAGNWTVGFSNQKEVQGVVMSNLTLRLSSLPTWIRAADNTGTGFVAVS